MKKKLIIFDMDGTLYLGNQLFDGVKNLFEKLKEENIHYVFFTNNSSHNLDFYEAKMKRFNIPCSLEENFSSSVEVTISYLFKNNIKDIYVVGNKSLREKFAKHFNLITSYDKDIKIDAVVCGFTTELVYEELKTAALFLETRKDIEFIATNGDYRCPIEDGLYLPDCGGMIEWLFLTTGKRAKVMGKPSPVVVESLMDRFGVTKEETMVVGDRLYTDILVGVNAGVDSVAVLTGETNMDEINKSEYKPTYVCESVVDLMSIIKDNKIT